MKKYLFTIIIAMGGLLFSEGLSAQSTKGNNWFVGANTGLNVGYDGLREFWDFSNYGYGPSFDIYAGKWFSQKIGARLGYQGNGTSVDRKEWNQSPYGLIHGDILLNLSNLISGDKPERTVNVIPYVNAGYVMCEENGFSGGAGVMVPIRISDLVSIVPELKMNFFNDNIVGMTRDYGAMNGTASLGLLFNLGKKKAAPAPLVIPAPVVVPQPAPEPVPEPEPEPTPEPEPAPVVVEETLTLENIYFPFDVYTITDADKEILSKAAEAINNMGKNVVIVYGNTDNYGTDAYNIELSKKRAKTVADYLIKSGVSAEKITTEALSFSNPAAFNDTKEGRALNRRVEIIVK